MDLPASPPPTSPTPPAPRLAVDAEAVAIPASDDEAAGAAPAHGGGDNAALIDDADGVNAAPAHNTVLIDDGDASPLAADSNHSPSRGENSPPLADWNRKRGRPRKTPVPPPVGDVDDTDGDDDESPVLAATADTGGKRKRGPHSSGVAAVTKKKGKEEEAVCSICFDKRGSMKAYHPACVFREEAYLRTKGLRNCAKSGTQICIPDSGSVVGENNYSDSMANNRRCMEISYNTTDTKGPSMDIACVRTQCMASLRSFGPDLPYETYDVVVRCIADCPQYAKEYLLYAPEDRQLEWLEYKTPEKYKEKFEEWRSKLVQEALR